MENKAFEKDDDHAGINNNKQMEIEEPQGRVRRWQTEKFNIYKNLLLISVSFLALFIGFESMSKLQSSINSVNNLGTWANTSVYASLIISCCFMPSFLIKKLKVKWTLVLSILCYSSYIAAQFYPEFYTLIPTAFILGLGAAPLWSAKCTYLTQIAHRLAAIQNIDPEPVVVKFFGIFFFFFQCNSIVGNIISTAVFSSNLDTNFTITDSVLATCGSDYCPAQIVVQDKQDSNVTKEGDDNFEKAKDLTSIYTLAGIFLALSFFAAFVVSVFVDPLSRFVENEGKEVGKKSGGQLLISTFNHMKKKEQLLIIPITFWSGIEQGFFNADFTAGFVTCAYGVHIVGRVLIVFGICDAAASVGFGFIIKKIGRTPIFILGAVINLVVIIVMLSWSPSRDQVAVVYVLAALWGTADAIWQTQINALYGVLFANEEEAAFSNYRLWESLGFLLAFITQAMGVCVFPKLILAIFFLAAGMTGFAILEFKIKKDGDSK